jgi:hypothetical protein
MVLFLDFDGVLHPDPPNSSNPLWCRTDLLVNWLNARPEVEVVVSSTWRRTYNFQELQDLVPPGLACKLVGCTGLVHEELYARQRECEEWMRANRDPWVNWVALDDRVWNFRPFEKRLIICPRSSGINLQVIQALDNLSRTLLA